jgi:hypothetical protein
MYNHLQIFSVLNKTIADSMEDADLVLPIVEAAIKDKQVLDLSFEGLDICSTIFLNNFLGKLYLSFGASVDQYVRYTGFDAQNPVIPNRIERLKRRALNPEAFTDTFNNAIGNS